MGSDADAQKAISSLHESGFGGRSLSVNEARPQPARTNGGGGGGNYGGRSRSDRRW
jgi:hypothetical protein